jgi:2-polyprenyl-3-methyl-5-hydroxy-6-metoxy-1,4-benzoquinol methylase
VLVDGSRRPGRVPCLFCIHARRRKQPAEWRSLCGRCRGLTEDELNVLYWYQEEDDDCVVVAPTMLRHSRENSDARYRAGRAALDGMGLPRGGRLLDIGCGISAQAGLFADFRYVGADLNRPRLGRGRRAHPWARYAVQDITRMGWRNAAFDAILCLEVIEHLPVAARAGLVRELLRVLRPGGAIVLSTPNGRLTPWKRVLGRKCERSHEQELTHAEVEALVAGAGGVLRLVESVDNLILPAGKLSAGLLHLVATSDRWQRRVRRLARAAGYETLLYLITTAAGARAGADAAEARR